MVTIRQTAVYAAWFDQLRDLQARARILARVRRLSLGNPGDVKPVGQGVSELRIAYGPGYRIYYRQVGAAVALLLCGGDKSSQQRDIVSAQRMAREMEE